MAPHNVKLSKEKWSVTRKLLEMSLVYWTAKKNQSFYQPPMTNYVIYYASMCLIDIHFTAQLRAIGCSWRIKIIFLIKDNYSAGPPVQKS